MLDAAGHNPDVEQILRAFLEPVMEVPVQTVGPLMGRVLSNPDLFVDRVFNKHLAPVAERFVAALGRALPESPRAELLWRLHFSIGVMTHSIRWAQILPRITGGVCDVTDREALVDRAVQFLAAGFRAAASQESKPERNPACV